MLGRVLFVDDEPEVIEGLRDALGGQPYELLSALSGVDALAKLAAGPVDILVTDERMPDMRGSDLVIQVNLLYPEVVKIILTGRADLDAAIRSINQGQIFRLLRKPCDPEALGAVLREAFRHRVLTGVSARILEFSRTHSTWLWTDAEAADPRKTTEWPAFVAAGGGYAGAANDPVERLAPGERDTLSPREREILREVIAGRRTPEVARRLYISVHTARNHLKTIYKKLQVHSQAELVRKVLAS